MLCTSNTLVQAADAPSASGCGWLPPSTRAALMPATCWTATRVCMLVEIQCSNVMMGGVLLMLHCAFIPPSSGAEHAPLAAAQHLQHGQL